MPEKEEPKKERSKISLRIGEVQIEMEGTYDEIAKLMGKDLLEFTKGLQEQKKPLAPSTPITVQAASKAPESTPKTLEAAPKAPPAKPSTTEVSAQPPTTPAMTKTFDKKAPEENLRQNNSHSLGFGVHYSCRRLNWRTGGLHAKGQLFGSAGS